MNGLAFLLIALTISVIGCLVLWMRTRRPSSLDSGIDAFQREMRALAPQRSTGGAPVARRPAGQPADRRGRRRAG